MSLQKWFQANQYNYTPPDVLRGHQVPKAPEASAVPNLLDPEQMGRIMHSLGNQGVTQGIDAQAGAMGNVLDYRHRSDALDERQARGKAAIQDSQHRNQTETLVSGTERLQKGSWERGMGVADRYADLARGTTGAVSGAISGEQANDAARLQLMRDVLMKPKSFTQTLGELVGTLAPIASLFIG